MATAVFHTAFIGDLLLTIPFLKRARAISGHVSLICRPGLGEFFKKLGLVDEAYELDKKDRNSVAGFYDFLNAREYDRLICPHRSFRSAWMLRGTKVPVKVGYTAWWNRPFFDARVVRPMHLPEALRVLALLMPLDEWSQEKVNRLSLDRRWHNPRGMDAVESWKHSIPEELSMRVNAVAVEETFARHRLRDPFVIIAPSSQWPTKRWTVDGFAELIKRLQKRNLNIYAVGSRAEAAQVDDILGRVHARAEHLELRSLAGETSLLELHAIMSKAKAVIANDSGPMHLAAAAGVPSVAIFGPTTLSLGYRPWSDVSRVAQVPMDCRPCGKHGHKKCPIGTHDCMRKIGAAEIERLLFNSLS